MTAIAVLVVIFYIVFRTGFNQRFADQAAAAILCLA